jgi:hypothetical protein
MTNEFLEFCEKEKAKNPKIIAARIKEKIAAKWEVSFTAAESIYNYHCLKYGFDLECKGRSFSAAVKSRVNEKYSYIIEKATELAAKNKSYETKEQFARELNKVLIKEKKVNITSNNLKVLLSKLKFNYTEK